MVDLSCKYYDPFGRNTADLYFSMYWAFRYRTGLWARYNYLLGAAFDAGYNLNLLLVFLIFGSGKIISMPYWWGNNENSSERCFALD